MNESFNWNYWEFGRTHFTALANLRSLQNGEQAKLALLPDKVLEVDPNDNCDAASVDNRKVHQISDLGHNRPKRKFLDCLVKFAVNMKNGKTVAYTAMKKAEDNVMV